MGSRREEERNERIVRGLMKLPPNRRCINCNTLGPQYVCTNFWTFVCMTCSGIHREFTHRVKSVSMSKFTSQEVESLQNGGNQRARENFLKDWDLQSQRLPTNSNVDKVREFIKSVYVDRRYAGGKSADKPPRDLQRLGSNEDDTRRASSYHSYSQSPPYDFQYEDRRYGKQAAVLTRKPGSERGLFTGKMSSFISSPTHLSDKSLEDRFANEGSVSRFSDYSVSSGGDRSRSGVESPNFQKDGGFSSPPVQSSRNVVGEDLFSEAHFRRDANGIPPRQRTGSLGSMGSFDSNSMSQKSYNSGSLADSFSEPEQTAQPHQDSMSAFPHASSSPGHSSLNLFEAPIFPEPGTSPAPPIDLFQLPTTSQSSSVDLFQASSNPTSSVNFNPSSQNSAQSSVDLFADISQQQPPSKQDENAVEQHEDVGWATFDTQFPMAVPVTANFSLEAPLAKPSCMSSTMHDRLSSLNTMQWPGFQNSNVQSSSSVSGPWHQNLHAVQSAASTAGAPTWNAFDDPPVNDIKEVNEPLAESFSPLSAADQYVGQRFLEGSNKDGIQSAASYGGFPGPNGPSDFAVESSYAPFAPPPVIEDKLPHPTNHKSTNPFDLLFDDSLLEPDHMFMDMNSLHAALPSVRMPSPFIDDVGVGQPWFPEDPASAYFPADPQGVAYIERQAPNPPLTNVQAQGPVASVGGNPFA